MQGLRAIAVTKSKYQGKNRIVTQEGIDNLWLDDLTENSLRELFLAWFNAYEQSQTNHQAWLNAIDQGTRQLWQPLMSPLINHLQQRNFQQAILIPTGLLSFLPLHGRLGLISNQADMI